MLRWRKLHTEVSLALIAQHSKISIAEPALE